MRLSRRRFLPLPLLVLVAACAAPPSAGVGAVRKMTAEGGSYTLTTPAQLHSMLQNKSFPLINVHVPYEGEIEPTDALIPYDRIADNLDKLPKDRTARIFLYCRSGNMSATAAKTLVRLGYTDVWDLEGGMFAWKQAGYPILDKQR